MALHQRGEKERYNLISPGGTERPVLDKYRAVADFADTHGKYTYNEKGDEIKREK